MFFALYDQTARKEYSFEVAEITHARYWDNNGRDVRDVNEMISELADRLERQYGVLDIDCCQDYFGYGSYEIASGDYHMVLNEFRELFIARGYKVGEPVNKRFRNLEDRELPRQSEPTLDFD